MSVSSWDDYPVHQAAEFVRHPATSDRNFYDRYYFNLHGCNDAYNAIFGLGQYPNLGVTDAFIAVRIGGEQHVVRSSRPLDDRADTSVGPIRVEVIEPLRRLRVVVEPTEHSVAMDVTWQGHTPVVAEPRQHIRTKERVMFDTQRIAQTGFWSGTLTVAGNTHTITPDTHWGVRDRSWGVRPVGEPEADGIRKGTMVLGGMWNYFPMQFADHSIMYICHERDDGGRPLQQGQRIWLDGTIEELGPPTHVHTFAPGSRLLAHSVIGYPQAGIEIDCTPLLANYFVVGTGYGLDRDWRHGMYQGPDLVVQGLVLQVEEIRTRATLAVVDQVARFTYDGNVGYGLYEHGFAGPFRRYGMADAFGPPAGAA